MWHFSVWARFGRIGGCLVVLTGLVGCLGFQPAIEPPRLSLIDLRVESIQLFEQRYRLTFRVLNPNATPIPVTGVFADVFLADQPFASGVSDQPFTVDGYGQTTFDMHVGTSLFKTITGLAQLDPEATEPLAYRITGWVQVALPAAGRIRFNVAGQLPAEPVE